MPSGPVISQAWCVAEIESLGISERSALGSHIATVIEHFLKLQTPAQEPRRGWVDSVLHARRSIGRVPEASP
ncbi:MAG: DUF29 domain-containing protein, partial [Pseudomonadota bacterium]|nr:DUF29 domain-containing protein [Pseudomonadota bacterium]